MRSILAFFGALFLASGITLAAEGDRVSILLKDGSRILGQILEESESTLRVRTDAGAEMSIPREAIESLRARQGRYQFEDPNYSRLMLAPTGRPLHKGHGYFNDVYVLFPSFSYGLTDHVGLTAGMSTVPGLGLTDQLFYVTPRVGFEPSPNFAVSAGVLYATGSLDDDSPSNAGAGIAFGAATIGPPDKSLTLGLGYGYTRDNGDVDFGSTPVLMLGGNLRLSNRIALVSESWMLLDEGWELAQQPFGVAARFLGERVSADLGFILVGDVLEEGLPIPWLSVSYHIGRR